jgi:hypothetical protein
MTVITLPFPISVNAMYADGATRRIKSQRYCDWIMEAGYALNRQHPPSIKGKVRVRYILEEFIDGRERDAFNFEKGVTDLLVAHRVIEKDSNKILRGGSIYWDDFGTVRGVQITISPVGSDHRVPELKPENAHERETVDP